MDALIRIHEAVHWRFAYFTMYVILISLRKLKENFKNEPSYLGSGNIAQRSPWKHYISLNLLIYLTWEFCILVHNMYFLFVDFKIFLPLHYSFPVSILFGHFMEFVFILHEELYERLNACLCHVLYSFSLLYLPVLFFLWPY